MKNIGKAFINIKKVKVGEKRGFKITYEVGEYGIDDSGEILIARRDVCDSAIPQFTDPSAEGYVSVVSNGPAQVTAEYIPTRHIRPWKACISIRIKDGSLYPGDIVYIKFGSPAGPGYRMQTFPEDNHIFKVLVDCAGSGDFYEIDDSPAIQITGGAPHTVEICAPSYIAPGQPFKILARALDSYGNISDMTNTDALITIGDVTRKTELKGGTAFIDNFKLEKEGLYYPRIVLSKTSLNGGGNPIICTGAPPSLYWGDMHGQTGETVGTGTPERYFSFARDKAGLDFSGWQGNDFQITDELWAKMEKVVREFNKPGEFVCFPGYEWSGATPVGGDHNIYFLNDGCKIHRSYRWQTGMENEDGSSRSPVSKLWDEFNGRDDVIAIPHVGGRYANFDFFNPELIPVVEIHSHHGSFEWFFRDALARGFKPGIIAASDDHSCRPGLSFPTEVSSRGGFVSFDVKGGYTAVFADSLDRKSIWEALKSRHCYGTSGERIIADVRCGDHMMGDEFEANTPPVIKIHAIGTAPIRNLYVMRNLDTAFSLNENRPRDKSKIFIEWSGVRIRSRSKKALWEGTIKVTHGTITNVLEYDVMKKTGDVELVSGNLMKFTSSTSGDTDGFELETIKTPQTLIEITTNHGNMKFKMEDIENMDITMEAGGVNLEIRAGHPPAMMQNLVDLGFIDANIGDGMNAYWVKIVQNNGHKAWTSPLYINHKR